VRSPEGQFRRGDIPDGIPLAEQRQGIRLLREFEGDLHRVNAEDRYQIWTRILGALRALIRRNPEAAGLTMDAIEQVDTLVFPHLRAAIDEWKRRSPGRWMDGWLSSL
jgi:hypothetical protein